MTYPLRPFKVLFTNYFPNSNIDCPVFPTYSPNKGCPFPGIMSEVRNFQSKILP